MNVDRTTQRYFALLEALGQAVIATDAEGVIIQWSAGAERLYEWRADDVVGRNILEVTPLDVSRTQGAEIMQALARGELWSGQFNVRTGRGRSFTASVTDIPLLNETGTVSGVVGVSAVARAPTKLRPLLKRFGKACDRIWPGQVTLDLAVPSDAVLPATEPHAIQLLAILVLLYADVLERGSGIEVQAGASEKSPFADFGLAFTSSALYIRIDRRNATPTYSVFRTLPLSTEPTKYASILVRAVGGMLIAGSAPDGLSAMHLFLPLGTPRTA